MWIIQVSILTSIICPANNSTKENGNMIDCVIYQCFTLIFIDNSAATETNKVKGKAVNDKDPNNFWISKDGDKDVVLNRHAKIILASVPVRSLIKDVKMGNVNMGVEDWAAFAVELFRKIGEDIKDRSLLMQVVIFIVIVIIEAMLGYVAYNLSQSVIHLFLSQLGYKDLFFLSFNILREVMKYFN